MSAITLIGSSFNITNYIISNIKSKILQEQNTKINKPNFKITLSTPWTIESNNINFPIWQLNNYGKSPITVEQLKVKFFLYTIMRITLRNEFKNKNISSVTFVPFILPLPNVGENTAILTGSNSGSLAYISNINMASNLSKKNWTDFKKKFHFHINDERKYNMDHPVSTINNRSTEYKLAKTIRINHNNKTDKKRDQYKEMGNVDSVDLPEEWGILCKTNLKYKVNGEQMIPKSFLSTTNNSIWTFPMNSRSYFQKLDSLFYDSKVVPSLKYDTTDSYFDIAYQQLQLAAKQGRLSEFTSHFEQLFSNGNDKDYKKNIDNALQLFSGNENKVFGIDSSAPTSKIDFKNQKFPYIKC